MCVNREDPIRHITFVYCKMLLQSVRCRDLIRIAALDSKPNRCILRDTNIRVEVAFTSGPYQNIKSIRIDLILFLLLSHWFPLWNALIEVKHTKISFIRVRFTANAVALDIQYQVHRSPSQVCRAPFGRTAAKQQTVANPKCRHQT